MRRDNYSLTNRNVAGAATARNASGINAAQANANRNAQMARDTSINKARQSAYTLAAKTASSNVERDISRSTQQSKTKAQQAYQSAEKKKSRDLKNAISDRERSYAKRQRQLKSYTGTVSTRYQSVKSVDKAIKKMRKSSTKDKSTKLAYLEALRASLLAAKKKGGSGGGGRSGGGRRGGYGRRGYGSSGGSSGDSVPTLNNGGGGKKKPKVDQKDVTALWSNAGRYIFQKNEKKADKSKAKTGSKTGFKTAKGRYTKSGSRAK